jgi:hypothetical protein
MAQNWEEDELEPRGGFVAAMNADGEFVKIADLDEDGNVTPVGRAKIEPEDQPMPVVHDDQPFIHDTVANEVLARSSARSPTSSARPSASTAGTMVSAFLLLVAWGIEFEHLFDGRETPPMPEGVQAELDRIAWLQRQFDRIDRERDDNW